MRTKVLNYLSSFAPRAENLKKNGLKLAALAGVVAFAAYHPFQSLAIAAATGYYLTRSPINKLTDPMIPSATLEEAIENDNMMAAMEILDREDRSIEPFFLARRQEEEILMNELRQRWLTTMLNHWE